MFVYVPQTAARENKINAEHFRVSGQLELHMNCDTKMACKSVGSENQAVEAKGKERILL